MSFLVVKIIREDEKFTTSVYCKPIFSGVCTQLEGFLLSTHKFGIVCTIA